MITKKLFTLFFAIYCVSLGNYLQAMYGMQEPLDASIQAQHQILNQRARGVIGKGSNLLRLPFYKEEGFKENFEIGVKEYSDLFRKKDKLDLFYDLPTLATFFGGLTASCVYFKKLENLCHGRFKAVAAILAGVSLATYGVHKLGTWVVNKIVMRDYYKKASKNPTISEHSETKNVA